VRAIHIAIHNNVVYDVLQMTSVPSVLLYVVESTRNRSHAKGHEFESRRPRHSLLSKRVVLISLKTNEDAKDTFLRPFCTPFRQFKARFTDPAVPLTRVSKRAAEFVRKTALARELLVESRALQAKLPAGEYQT
jgi:hypothetical protein